MADKKNDNFDPKIPSTSGKFSDPIRAQRPTPTPAFPENPWDIVLSQSTINCNVFVQNIFDEGQLISHNDWLGAFVGETLIGVKQWDTTECTGGVCSIQVMGNDGNDLTTSYANTGDMITYKIYIESTGAFLPITGYTILVEGMMDALSYGSWDGTWHNQGLFYIETLRHKLSRKKQTPDEFPGLLRQKGGRVRGKKR